MAGRCLGHRQPPRPGAAHATLGGLLHQQPDFCIKRGGFASKPSRSCCLQSQRRKLPFSVFLDPPARIPYMQVKELHIQRFRGFDDLSVKPKGHVVVMGEPVRDGPISLRLSRVYLMPMLAATESPPNWTSTTGTRLSQSRSRLPSVILGLI